jgi:hypothetical protein
MFSIRALPFLLLALLPACTTIEEPRFSPSAVRPGQRTVLIVYPSPSPWVIADPDSKAESAAKTLPGLSFIVQSFQEERSLKESKDLQQYLPRWAAEKKLLAALLEELPKSGFTGSLSLPEQANLTLDQLRQFNRSPDVLAWQKKYFYEEGGRSLDRNYSALLHLDDALIFEVNLLYGVNGNDEGNMVPVLSASSRLLRANTLRTLWRHEDSVEDPQAARSLYEFKSLPLQLVDNWDRLMPQLAAKIASSLKTASLEYPSTAPSPAAP